MAFAKHGGIRGSPKFTTPIAHVEHGQIQYHPVFNTLPSGLQKSITIHEQAHLGGKRRNRRLFQTSAYNLKDSSIIGLQLAIAIASLPSAVYQGQICRWRLGLNQIIWFSDSRRINPYSYFLSHLLLLWYGAYLWVSLIISAGQLRDRKLV